MPIDPSLFKAYDIRGTTTATLTPAFAALLGAAFGALVHSRGNKCVAVGRDGRLSGPALALALIQGLRRAGLEVIDLGMCTTPMAYFAASQLTENAIMVTGSHNPRDDNGFKLVLGNEALYGEAIAQLHSMMEQIEAGGPALSGGGGPPVREHDILPAYLGRIVGDIHLKRPMKVALDCGNGVAGASTPKILRAIGAQVLELYTEVDGSFPAHHPDPSKPENLRDLQNVLARSDAEIGLALDGDGDRLGVLTRQGQIIYPDRQLMLFAADVLARNPGGAVVFDVKCTQLLAPVIESAGGRALMNKTGHSLIKAKMRESRAVLGGEMSGHIFFQERWFGFDDGTYAACRLLEILSDCADPSAQLNALPMRASTPELNVPCAPGEPQRLTTALLAAATELFPPPARLTTLDGLRVDWSDGFGLIRASNTTPQLVLRFEGVDEAALSRIKGQMVDLLLRLKPDAQLSSAGAHSH